MEILTQVEIQFKIDIGHFLFSILVGISDEPRKDIFDDE